MIDKLSAKESLRLRREEEKAARREAIVDACEAVIEKKGWDETNFGDIAREARLSRSLVYFYFPTRDELFHALCTRGLLEMQRRFALAMSRATEGLDQLMAIAKAYYKFSQECPLYFSMISDYQEREAKPDEDSDTVTEANERGRACLGRVAEAIALGVQDGSIRPSVGEVGPAAISIWAFTHGLIQIASRKEAMIKADFNMNTHQAMERGFALLRSSLSAKR